MVGVVGSLPRRGVAGGRGAETQGARAYGQSMPPPLTDPGVPAVLEPQNQEITSLVAPTTPSIASRRL